MDAPQATPFGPSCPGCWSTCGLDQHALLESELLLVLSGQRRNTQAQTILCSRSRLCTRMLTWLGSLKLCNDNLELVTFAFTPHFQLALGTRLSGSDNTRQITPLLDLLDRKTVV